MLPILLAVAASSAFPAPGTYRYAAAVGGQRIGEWSVSVKAGDSGTEIDENSAGTFAGMQVAATASLVLGPDLAPTRYAGSYRTAGQSPTVNVALTPTSATIVGGIAESTRTLALEPNTHHFVVIEPALLAGLFALPAQLQAWGDDPVTWVAPITSQEQTLAKSSANPGPRPSSVPAQDVGLSLQAQFPVIIWYDPTTLVPDEVIVPSQNAVLTREKSEPPAPC
jgi:hypothetical protein